MLELPVVKWMPERNEYDIEWCGEIFIRDTAEEVKILMAYIFCDEDEPVCNVSVTFAGDFFWSGPREEL